jgi:murein L,D-transpeptidase YafK
MRTPSFFLAALAILPFATPAPAADSAAAPAAPTARGGNASARGGNASARGGNAIARLWVSKSKHELRTIAKDGSTIATYTVAIGPGGKGHKLQEGDLVTPVGRYHVVLHAMTRWHQFLLLDYPNAADRARFAELKKSGALPKDATIGGQIGIHGSPSQAERKANHKATDWTLGCVALDDAEIAELSAQVKDGTPVDIED